MSALKTVDKIPQETLALAEFLKVQIACKGVDTKTLAYATGISITAINALKRGEGNPQLGTLLALAKYFDTSIDKMLSQDTDASTPSANQVRIPVFSINDAEKRPSNQALYTITTEQPDSSAADLFAIELHNNVMSPFYEKGAIFIISPHIQHTDGDIVLIKSHDGVLSLRKVFTVGEHCQFQAIGLNTTPQTYSKYKILGVVVKAIQQLR